jgi:hypothetical protein
VVAKGSAVKHNDSRAIARVEVGWLISSGGPATALTGLLKRLPASKTKSSAQKNFDLIRKVEKRNRLSQVTRQSCVGVWRRRLIVGGLFIMREDRAAEPRELQTTGVWELRLTSERRSGSKNQGPGVRE